MTRGMATSHSAGTTTHAAEDRNPLLIDSGCLGLKHEFYGLVNDLDMQRDSVVTFQDSRVYFTVLEHRSDRRSRLHKKELTVTQTGNAGLPRKWVLVGSPARIQVFGIP